MLKAIHQRGTRDKIVPSRLGLPWLGTQPNIYGAEPLKCIPAGVYPCVPYFSPKRQENCWLLENTPGFTGVEIHIGNFGCEAMFQGELHPSDTEACLIYGFGYDSDIPMLLESAKAIEYLHETIGLTTTWLIDIRD